MASISTNQTTGLRRILFAGRDGARKPPIRLGRCSMAYADLVRGHVAELVDALAAGRPERWETAEWLKTADPKLRKRLVRLGLVVPRVDAKPVPLEPFL